MIEEIEINDKVASLLREMYPDKSLDFIVDMALKSYIKVIKMHNEYEKTDKKVIETWGETHYIDPNRDN